MNHAKPCRDSGKQSAETWLTNDDADKFEILEECAPRAQWRGHGFAQYHDDEMLEAGFDRDLWTSERARSNYQSVRNEYPYASTNSVPHTEKSSQIDLSRSFSHPAQLKRLYC
jgi:hypothetical protein